MAQWADENGPYLHPNQDQVLTIDLGLVALGGVHRHAYFESSGNNENGGVYDPSS